MKTGPHEISLGMGIGVANGYHKVNTVFPKFA